MLDAIFGRRAALAAIRERDDLRAELESCRSAADSVAAHRDRLGRAHVEACRKSLAVANESARAREESRAELAAVWAELAVAVAEQGHIRNGFLAELRAAGELTEEAAFALDRCRAEHKQTIEGFAADVAAALARAEAAEADLATTRSRETSLENRISAISDALYLAADM